ncbi:MAG: hypothetical protein H6706_29930 [Myxococcales bacterium]|nr:hypothetical protein [Myxococcales bacterium]
MVARLLPLLGALALWACGSASPPPDAALAGWLAARNRPLIVVGPERVTLQRAGAPDVEHPIDEAPGALLLRLARLPLEAHQAAALRGQPVLDAAAAEALGQRRAAVGALRKALPTLAEALRADQEKLLALVEETLDGARRAGRVDLAWLTLQARRARPLIDDNLREVAELRLDALHARVAAFWAVLAPEERALLRVVIVGTSADRAGHWAGQYFERVLDAPLGGPRLTYAPLAEAPAAHLDALLVDEALGADVFEDPARLRRDLLADAAESWLDRVGPTLAGEAP